MRPLLEVRGVSKAYPIRAGAFGRPSGLVHAVDGVDLEVLPGETLGLVGESGCGKSTLARIILALERPDEGCVTFDGMDVSNPSRRDRARLKQGMQVVFQDPFGSLNPRQRVGASVAEPLHIHRTGKRAAIREKAARLFELVGLSVEMMDRYPHEFSGGQRQRICIARALAVDPKLLVCDEPVSALDVSIQAQVINLLVDLQQDLGLAYIFISHDLSVVGYISDRVAVMYRGRIVEMAPSAAIFERALHPYTQCLMQAIPAVHPGEAPVPPVCAANGVHVPDEAGCAFSMSCPLSAEQCRQRPALLERAPGHWVACHWQAPQRP